MLDYPVVVGYLCGSIQSEMGKINLTIADGIIKIEHLQGNSSTVTGTDYIAAANVCRIRDEITGWWLDRLYQTNFDQRIVFADIVNYNGSAIGETSQATVTAALVAAITPE